MTNYKNYKIVEVAAVKYVCPCPKATQLCVVSSMSTAKGKALSKITQHELGEAHVHWVACASDKEQAELESLKDGGVNPRAEQRCIAREAVHQHYLSYCQQKRLTDSDEE